MERLASLKINKMKQDTTLAEDYLLKNNYSFRSLGCSESLDAKCPPLPVTTVTGVIKVIPTNVKAVNEFTLPECWKEESYDKLKESTRQLIKKIEENAELICQLEFLIREIPIDDVKLDLKLLVQYMKHYVSSNLSFWKLKYKISFLAVYSCSPLSVLGIMMHFFGTLVDPGIVTAAATAPICHLFTQLCHEVGIRPITLYVVEHPLNAIKQMGSKYLIDADYISEAGCAGVVTGKADIDSAVDAFLAATVKHPWRVRRILVQESVYEQFQMALAWQCDQIDNDTIGFDSLLVKRSAKVLAYAKKLFAIDFAGDLSKLEHQDHVTLVEAYRTTKELMGILEKLNPVYLSLWSNNISEANEIAYGVTLPVIWINDLAVFECPPKMAPAYFAALEGKFKVKISVDEGKIEDFLKAQSNWLKLSIDERKNYINKVFNEYKDKINTKEKIDRINKLQKSIAIVPETKTIVIENNKIWVGIEDIVGIVVGDINDEEILKSLILGNAVVLLQEIEALNEDKTIPHIMRSTSRTNKEVECYMQCLKPRTVVTNFGTTFAN